MALSAEGISKSYGRKAVVLDVSLRVEQSEIVGLLGSNGAGKTTSFYCIVGISKVDGGTITIDDVNVTNMPMHNRARLGLGYLPQEASVFRRLTTRQNIAAVLDLCKDRPRAQRPARIEELLAEFDLTRVAETRGERLSGGERRRLEIARALAANPKYLLFDEPFAGVDPISVEEIKKNLLGLSKRGYWRTNNETTTYGKHWISLTVRTSCMLVASSLKAILTHYWPIRKYAMSI